MASIKDLMSHQRILVLVIIFLALQLIIISGARAEYRVYKLGVKLNAQSPEQEVVTTLDDQQYPTYFKLSPTQQVRLIQHWMCRGRTDDFKRYCPGPISNKANQNMTPTGVRAPAENNALAAPAAPVQNPVPVGKP